MNFTVSLIDHGRDAVQDGGEFFCHARRTRWKGQLIWKADDHIAINAFQPDLIAKSHVFKNGAECFFKRLGFFFFAVGLIDFDFWRFGLWNFCNNPWGVRCWRL